MALCLCMTHKMAERETIGCGYSKVLKGTKGNELSVGLSFVGGDSCLLHVLLWL